jgi:hypothetical protein
MVKQISFDQTRQTNKISQLMDLLITLSADREHAQLLPKPYVELLNYIDCEKERVKESNNVPILSLSDIMDRWYGSGESCGFPNMLIAT